MPLVVVRICPATVLVAAVLVAASLVLDVPEDALSVAAASGTAVVGVTGATVPGGGRAGVGATDGTAGKPVVCAADVDGSGAALAVAEGAVAVAVAEARGGDAAEAVAGTAVDVADAEEAANVDDDNEGVALVEETAATEGSSAEVVVEEPERLTPTTTPTMARAPTTPTSSGTRLASRRFEELSTG